MLATLLTGAALTAALPWLLRRLPRATAWLPATFAAGITLYLLFQIPAVQAGAFLREDLVWAPTLGISLSLRLDGLGLLFSLLIAGIGVLVALYAAEYLKDDPRLGRFFVFLLLFMTAMLGLAWSDNALGLFVFWELTSISSFLLIGFDHEQEKSRKAALQALLVTAGGGLALLAGLVMLGQMTGTLQISQLNLSGDAIRAHPLYPAALVLILLGAFTKSAQFPFHFWLPGAMAAPTPVSAYLHSATMVKAGVFLLARLSPALAGTPLWTELVSAVGMLTLLAGALLALAQTDLKLLLAYSTVGSLGGMVYLLGQGTPLAVKAALTFLFGHALYKGALFLAAGGVDHAVHTRDITRLGGLGRVMPFGFAGAALAGISMLGLPPAFGFIAKELVYEVTLQSARSGLATAGALLALAGVGAVAGWTALKPYVGQPGEAAAHAHEGPVRLWLPPLILGVLGVAAGLFSGWTGRVLLEPAVKATLGQAYPVKLTLWHGLTPMLWLSAATLGLAGLAYVLRAPLQTFFAGLFARLAPAGPARLYEAGLEGLKHGAEAQTRAVQSGYLNIYIRVIILVVTGLVGAVLLARPQGLAVAGWGPLRFYDVALVGVIIAAVVAVVRSTSRLATIAILGAIGFSISLIYLLYSAPDLAMVQFAIETLTVLLFVLVIYRLPKFTRIASVRTRGLDVLVALGGGALMTLLVLLVTALPPPESIAAYFVENSLPLANGRNVVNVILVDFRGFDTLGEIVVLALAAAGASALLTLDVRRGKRSDQGEGK